MCVKLVIYRDLTRLHGQQGIKMLDQHSSTYRIKLELPALKETEDRRAEDEATRQ